ncbi:MAG: NAD(P)/FAD-dependent oxidoreductase [Acholeplasmataceae bacterium]|jgi:thioredoxin reductase (NADPH)|nr:NAD(P)/FAD-dependent oxidoreductase [Acholeplasmataceae bacterium]
MKKIIIIGYGPAGISAAIYLKRAGIDPLVIGKDFGALEGYTDLVENYYGFDKPIEGKQLIQNGIEQAKRLGIEVLQDSVISLKMDDHGFQVTTTNHRYHSRAVLLSTGKTRTTLNIPGFIKYRGKGISLCATCDGYFYRKKKLAVVGCGAYMLHELEYLTRISNDITIFTHGNQLNAEVEQNIVSDPIISFKGTDKITHIETTQGTYEVDGVFIALGVPSSIDFASALGVIVEKNSLVVDENYQTNIEGLFAAGDIIGGKLQIAKAVYDGMEAADSIYQYLKNKS